MIDFRNFDAKQPRQFFVTDFGNVAVAALLNYKKCIISMKKRSETGQLKAIYCGTEITAIAKQCNEVMALKGQ